GQMRRELDIRGFQRVTVPLWLAAFCAQNGWPALRGLLQPKWLLRKGRELRFTLSPELDQDASHPLNLAIDRIAAWARQDPSRLKRLFDPDPQDPLDPDSGREGALEAQASTAPEAAPAPPQDQPAPQAGSYRLSVVVEMANALYWKQHGAESHQSVEQFCRIAREYPEVEVLFVTDCPAQVGDSALSNVRSLLSPDPTYFGMKRFGMLQARSDLIAFVDSDCRYPPDYPEQVLAAFSDPRVHMVGGKTRYSPTSARNKAASIRDWGHLPDRGSFPLHIAANNFAAQRWVLEKYHFGEGFQRVGGEVALCILAKLDNLQIHYLPDLVDRHHDFYQSLGPSLYLLFMDYPATVDMARRALIRLGKRSSRYAAGFLRLLPIWIWWMKCVACARNYGLMRDELEIRGVQRVTVPLWLVILSLLNLGVALRCTLQPGWMMKKGAELGFTLSTELDRDPNHPLNLAIDCITTWIRQDKKRLTRLFVQAEARKEDSGLRPRIAAEKL
ncbi:MAG: glycosyltransferase, partial [Terriglobales bacterium]